MKSNLIKSKKPNLKQKIQKKRLEKLKGKQNVIKKKIVMILKYLKQNLLI